MLYECDLSADSVSLPSQSYLPQSARDHKYTPNATISIRSWKKIVLVARVPEGQYQQRDITERNWRSGLSFQVRAPLLGNGLCRDYSCFYQEQTLQKDCTWWLCFDLWLDHLFGGAIINARLSAPCFTKSGWIIIKNPKPTALLFSLIFLLFSIGFISCSWQREPNLLPALTR